MRRRLFAAAFALLLVMQGVTLAASQDDYKGAQFVWVSLGKQNVETGIRQLQEPWNGLTVEALEGTARKTLLNTAPRPQPVDPAAAADKGRYVYFDVHDTYIKGGKNKVVLTITFHDVGLTPIYLDYDSIDEARPGSTDRKVTHKRMAVAARQNTENWVTQRIEIDDARFANLLEGGDFRIGSDTDLVLRSVALVLVHHEEPLPPIKVLLGGQEIVFDVAPFVDPATDRTLVPMRAIFEALGAQVSWDGVLRAVTATKGGTTIVLAIDSPQALVSGRPVALDQPPRIVEDRTVVPLRFVSEQLGLSVDWNGETRTILLTPVSQAAPAPSPAPQSQGSETTTQAPQDGQPTAPTPPGLPSLPGPTAPSAPSVPSVPPVTPSTP